MASSALWSVSEGLLGMLVVSGSSGTGICVICTSGPGRFVILRRYEGISETCKTVNAMYTV